MRRRTLLAVAAVGGATGAVSLRKKRNRLSEANKALARRLREEALSRGRLDVVDELVAPSYVGHDPARPEEIRGPEGIKQAIGAYREAFPDIRIRIHDQVAAGDRVVTRWTGTGTHQAELFGVAGTGKQVTVTGITIDRIEDGKIAESWDSWDTLGLLQQLGAVPAPEAATA